MASTHASSWYCVSRTSLLHWNTFMRTLHRYGAIAQYNTPCFTASSIFFRSISCSENHFRVSSGWFILRKALKCSCCSPIVVLRWYSAFRPEVIQIISTYLFYILNLKSVVWNSGGFGQIKRCRLEACVKSSKRFPVFKINSERGQSRWQDNFTLMKFIVSACY